MRIVHTALVALLLTGLCALSSGPAHAERKVYLNGVDVADVDVRGHRFDGCEVRFDKAGNIYITVKGLKIETAAASTNKNNSPATLGKRYFMVVKPVRGGNAPYRVTVYLNGKLTRLVKGSNEMQVFEITKYVRPGDNQVRIIAVRELGKKALSRAPEDVLEIVLGRGTIKNGAVIIQVPHVEYRRNASETKRFDETFHFAGE